MEGNDRDRKKNMASCISPDIDAMTSQSPLEQCIHHLRKHAAKLSPDVRELFECTNPIPAVARFVRTCTNAELWDEFSGLMHTLVNVPAALLQLRFFGSLFADQPPASCCLIAHLLRRVHDGPCAMCDCSATCACAVVYQRLHASDAAAIMRTYTGADALHAVCTDPTMSIEEVAVVLDMLQQYGCGK